MIANKHILLIAEIASWVLMITLGKKRHHEKKAAEKIYKTELSTWDGEGGNLPPQLSKSRSDSATSIQ